MKGAGHSSGEQQTPGEGRIPEEERGPEEGRIPEEEDVPVEGRILEEGGVPGEGGSSYRWVDLEVQRIGTVWVGEGRIPQD